MALDNRGKHTVSAEDPYRMRRKCLSRLPAHIGLLRSASDSPAQPVRVGTCPAGGCRAPPGVTEQDLLVVHVVSVRRPLAVHDEIAGQILPELTGRRRMGFRLARHGVGNVLGDRRGPVRIIGAGGCRRRQLLAPASVFWIEPTSWSVYLLEGGLLTDLAIFLERHSGQPRVSNRVLFHCLDQRDMSFSKKGAR